MSQYIQAYKIKSNPSIKSKTSQYNNYVANDGGLDAGDSFVGELEETNGFVNISIGARSSQDGLISLLQGFDSDFSKWNQNNTFKESFDFLEGVGTYYNFQIKAPYFRVVLENTGTEAQTYCRMFSKLLNS
jgi:hypothetical protein